MYSAVLVTHSLLRWVVLLLGIVAVGHLLVGWLGGRAWTRRDTLLGRFFVASLDVQLVLGLALYLLLSPVSRLALQNMGTAMRDPVLRFWAVEHAFGMVVAVIMAHVGLVLSRRATDDHQKLRRGAIFLGLAFLIVLATIPWPFLRAGRPLLPF